MIAASSVDNTAGVSVLFTLMTAIARGNWPVNVDCLFTTCEEAGFCGVVAELLDGSSFDAPNGEEIVCIVVDSSSHLRFWNQRPEHAGMSKVPSDAETIAIKLHEPVIRTGDGLKRVLVGRMVGGWCKATPLVVGNALRRRKGGRPPLNLRVGSIAIPIGGYRNSFKGELQAEKCHESALRGACQLLGEAIRLCHRWPFGFHVPPPDVTDDMAKTVDLLLTWQDVFGGLSSVTNDWIRTQTQDIAAAV